MSIDKKEFVPAEQLKMFQEIDGLKVIEDLLLFKGVEVAGATKTVSAKMLDDMALVTYGLKSNATNKLYTGLYLDRFYKRAGLVCSSGQIRVPIEIYERVKAINDAYKTKAGN